jgi:hypothetical protein
MLNGHGLIPTMSSSNLPDAAWADVPAGWQSDVQQQLLSGENVRACLEVDLDERLYFARGLLIVTDRRLLACPAEVPVGEATPARPWQATRTMLAWAPWR